MYVCVCMSVWVCLRRRSPRRHPSPTYMYTYDTWHVWLKIFVCMHLCIHVSRMFSSTWSVCVHVYPYARISSMPCVSGIPQIHSIHQVTERRNSVTERKHACESHVRSVAHVHSPSHGKTEFRHHLGQLCLRNGQEYHLRRSLRTSISSQFMHIYTYRQNVSV